MGAFLKKNWPLLALFVAIGVILTLLVALDRAQDDAIATLMADKAMRQVRARDAAIVAKYKPLLTAKDQELATLRLGVQRLGVTVAEKHRKLVEAQAKVRDLEGCQFLLQETIDTLESTSNEYTEKLSECDSLWGSKYATLEAREAERVAALTKRLGQVTESAYKAALRNSRKLIIGPQVHYGTGGMSVGFGVTWELWRLRAPGAGLQ